MENASKALLIAGAILLAILIIALGMRVFQNSSVNVNLDPQKAQAYNAEFEGYLGDNINGANVKALIRIVQSHNRANQADPSLQILINDSVDAPTTTAQTTVITMNENTADSAYNVNTYGTAKSYKVVGGFDPKSGYLVSIAIKQNT